MSIFLVSMPLIFEYSDFHMQILSILSLNHRLYKLKIKKGYKTEPCGIPARVLIHFDVCSLSRTVCRRFVGGLSSNSELGLKVCFLHHTT